jgi:hypothetical protein
MRPVQHIDLITAGTGRNGVDQLRFQGPALVAIAAPASQGNQLVPVACVEQQALFDAVKVAYLPQHIRRVMLRPLDLPEHLFACKTPA